MHHQMKLTTVLQILEQCGSAVHHLHQRRIMHRDIRAVNVLMVSKDPIHVAITDFGLSHQLSAFKDKFIPSVRSQAPIAHPLPFHAHKLS